MSTGPEVLPGPSDPMAVARAMLPDYTLGRLLTMRHWRGTWMQWDSTHWFEAEAATIRKEVYERLESAVYLKPIKDKGGVVGSEPTPWEPNRYKIANVLEALAACAHLPAAVDSPAWLDRTGSTGTIVACANGLLDVETRDLLDLTPAYFNLVAVPFDYIADAPAPTRWLEFLHQLWPDDEDTIAALQEWFGYIVSGRLDLQKILLLIGPTRSGKGTIARVLTAMIGKGHVAGPTLASLSGEFGLAPLLGKSLAVVSDARLGRAADASTVVERLLSVSGEDTLTVNRKYREQWTGRIPARFMILSNELPRFGDASGAIANRFVIAQMHHSFLGRENTALTGELLTELPGILSWALAGLDRLARSGSFTRPAASDDAIMALQDLVSPVAAFVRDRCDRGPYEVDVSDLHAAWGQWCDDNGHKRSSAQVFGRDIRAVVPEIQVRQPREGDARVRRWVGIRLASRTWFHSGSDRVPPRANTASEPLARGGTRAPHCGPDALLCRRCGRDPGPTGLGVSGLCASCEAGQGEGPPHPGD